MGGSIENPAGAVTLNPGGNLPAVGVVIEELLLLASAAAAAAAAAAVAARVRCGWRGAGRGGGWGGGGGEGGRMGMGVRALLAVAVGGGDGGVCGMYSDRATSSGCKSSSGAPVPITLSMACQFPFYWACSIHEPRSTFA